MWVRRLRPGGSPLLPALSRRSAPGVLVAPLSTVVCGRRHHLDRQPTRAGVSRKALSSPFPVAGPPLPLWQTQLGVQKTRRFQHMGGATEDKTPSVTMPIITDMFGHIWPADGGWGAGGVKTRVCLALSLMVGSKVVTTSVPFMFRSIVDSLTEVQNAASSATSAQEFAESILAVPTVELATPIAAMLVGYGVARSMALGMQEARNVVFATVSQPAVRVSPVVSLTTCTRLTSDFIYPGAQGRSRVFLTAALGLFSLLCRHSCSTWCPPCSSWAWYLPF